MNTITVKETFNSINRQLSNEAFKFFTLFFASKQTHTYGRRVSEKEREEAVNKRREERATEKSSCLYAACSSRG